MTKKYASRDLNKKPVSKLKKILDDVFAKWVKRNWSPDGIYVPCFTCGKSMTLGEGTTQAGHYISRTYSPVRYDENNVRPQCMYPCNAKHMGNGKPVEFERSLRLEVGDDVVDEMKERALDSWKWSRPWLVDKIEYYREQLKELEQ